MGMFVQTVSVGWAMAEIDDGAARIALVQTAANAPIMLFSILAGVLADVIPRRSVMLGAQIMLLCVGAALVAAALAGALTPWMLLGFTFLLGCGTALHGPAWQASVGELVPRKHVPAAVALNIVGNNAARTAGPAIGGLLVLAAGAAAGFAFNALTYLALVVVLWRWRPPVAAPRKTRFGDELRDGFYHALGAAGPRAVYIRALIFGMAASVIWGLMPYLALQLDGGPDLLGLLLGAVGVGGMLGALAATPLRRRIGPERLALGAGIAAMAGCLLVALGGNVPLALAGHAIAGVGWVCTLSTFNIAIQLSVERAQVGRQLSIYQTITFGSLAVGSALWGIFASHAGALAAYGAGAAILFAGVVLSGRAGLRLPDPIAMEHADAA